MDASQRLKDGQLLGRYQIVRLLGEGGMGAVYEAVHPALKKRFAIKTLLPSVAGSPPMVNDVIVGFAESMSIASRPFRTSTVVSPAVISTEMVASHRVRPGS